MMVTREQIVGACSHDPGNGEVFLAFTEFLTLDASRMYVSADDEYKARAASLPPLLALERVRGKVDRTRGQLAARVLRAFGAKSIVDVVEAVKEIGVPCSRNLAAELVADSLLLASEFAAAWNRSKLRKVQ